MQYNKMGNTGLYVSPLCLGTMTFADGANEKMSQDIYDMSRDRGINFFDCANVYANGDSERILGKLTKNERDKVIISTKAYYPVDADINARGLSRYHLTRAIEDSLKRLDTDYIDIYYLHCFDENTPLDESLATLDNFIQQGKILYVGLSNFAAWQVMKAIEVSKQFNSVKIACIQPMYNLLKRQCESEILPMAQSEGLGVFTYSPLGGGYLTGKYLSATPGSGRLNESDMYKKRYAEQNYITIVEAFSKFALENNYNPISLAIAWASSHPSVTAPLIGARNIEQLKPALASMDIQMTAELRGALSELSPGPAMPTDREEERSH